MSGLHVEDLHKTFSGAPAVNHVSFAAGPGEFISLLGPSGCGKTTTLRCIAGFERPDGGRIVVDGRVVSDPANGIFVPPNRRQFGMVFQSYAVWPHMTVRDNVSYPLRVRGAYSRTEIRARAEATLKIVGLAGYEERYPTQLSGGQQQRVALARALVMEPRLLLFDEPLSNLDAKLRERMRFELIEIQSKLGIPAVYVTHDQTEAMVMSRRVIVMERGSIAQQGSPEEIYASPRSRFVADFIGSSNFIEARLREQAGAGRWIADVAWGSLECSAEGVYAPGSAVTIAVRPERIGLTLEARQPNAIRGTMKGRFFLGPFIEYLVQIGGEVLHVQKTTAIDVAPGQPVFALLDPKYCQIVGLTQPETPAT
jgi:iron(III) transport system ATP-binding protein